MSYGNRRFRRLAAAGVLGLGTMTFLASPANAARDVSDACTTGIPEDGFTDTGAEGSTIETAVDCVAAYGVTSGTSATTYNPTGTVSRAQMATFIMTKLDLVNGFTRPANAPDAFTDDDGSVHENNINDAAALGIVGGIGGGLYDPDGNVTRAQMATFIVNQLDAAGVTIPATAPDAFTDDEGNTHEENINILADDAGFDIADGTSATEYSPNNPVTRGQMAFFLTRDLDLLVEEGLVDPIVASNQTFTVAGGLESAPIGSTRTCTVTGIPTGGVVDAVILPSEDVMVASNGIVTFADVGDDSLADVNAVSAAIVNVNGANVGPAQQVNDIVAAVGAISVTITGTAADDVTLVVYADPSTTATPAGNNLLNLNADNTPSEAFGVGCQTVFVPAEAGIGASTPTVVSVNRNLDFFTSASATYNYDANDTFQFGGVAITMAQFEAVLSPGDVLAVSYNPDPAGTSTFNITTDVVVDPSGVTATVINADGGATINDLRVSFTPGAGNGPETVFDIVADNVTNNNAIDAGETVFANNTTCTPAADGTCTFTFNNAPDGTYDILVRAENPTTGATSNTIDSSNVVVPGTPDTTGPLAEDAEQTTAAGFPGLVDAGDVIKVCFNEALGDVADADTEAVQITDADGTVIQLTSGTNATFALNAAASTDTSNVASTTSCPANQELTVSVTGAPTVLTAGTTAGLDVATGTFTAAADIEDTSGNLWDPTAVGNTDIAIAPEAGAEPT